MIEVVVYKNGKKTKSMHCKSPDGYFAVSNMEIFEILRDYPEHDFIFIDKNNGRKDITRECLLNILKTVESESVKPKIDLLPTINSGGFIERIKQLEANKRGLQCSEVKQ